MMDPPAEDAGVARRRGLTDAGRSIWRRVECRPETLPLTCHEIAGDAPLVGAACPIDTQAVRQRPPGVVRPDPVRQTRRAAIRPLRVDAIRAARERPAVSNRRP